MKTEAGVPGTVTDSERMTGTESDQERGTDTKRGVKMHGGRRDGEQRRRRAVEKTGKGRKRSRVHENVNLKDKNYNHRKKSLLALIYDATQKQQVQTY